MPAVDLYECLLIGIVRQLISAIVYFLVLSKQLISVIVDRNCPDNGFRRPYIINLTCVNKWFRRLSNDWNGPDN